ncbi:MAG TPA: hypothetical protein VF041_00835 [Gemmatimonadaceae bacterium]
MPDDMMTTAAGSGCARLARTLRRLTPALTPALALLALAACDPSKLLHVQDPDVATPGSLRTKEALPTVRNGVVGDFALAYGGSGNETEEGQISFSGLLSDEFVNSETFGTRIEIDQRLTRENNADNSDVFLELSRARAFADFGSARYNEFDAGNEGHAEVLNLGAYAYVLFAENYCSGVPFSTLNDDGTITFGDPLTTQQMLEQAIVRFDSATAIAGAAESAAQALLAAVGKARALVDLGQYADAAAVLAAAAVPDDFRYELQYSSNSTRQNNGVWEFTWNEGRWSVADAEGGNGLPFVSENDPRVQVVDGGTGFDNSTPLLLQTLYPDRGSFIPLATGTEARLIEAEAALAADDVAAFLGKLNGLRAAVGMPPLGDPGTPEARQDLLFHERAFWLFLTSHRLGDLRRLIRQYGRDPESVFPTGNYFKGGTYGPGVNLPIPVNELNNPKSTGCLNRDA